MRRKLKGALLLLTTVAAIALPAFPAHATTCAAADPTVDYVVCQTVYPLGGQIFCKTKLGCY